jgi:hypothetical protein
MNTPQEALAVGELEEHDARQRPFAEVQAALPNVRALVQF